VKIDAQIARVQGGKLQSVEPRDQTAWQLAWRRELEQAQRSQTQPAQPRKEPGEGDRHSESDSDPQLNHATTARTTPEGSGRPPSLDPAEKVLVASDASPLPPLANEGNRAIRAPDLASRPSPPVLATSAPALELPELPAQAPPLAPAAPIDVLMARMQRLDWMPQGAHVSLQGTRVSVALRDARLSEQDMQDLYRRLRKEVRGCGLELTALVVNGHLVRPDA
jgi:hypothetical protein